MHESIPGTKKFVQGTNPATYMLDVIGAGTGADQAAEARRPKIDYAVAYENSSLKRANDTRLATDFRGVPVGVDPDPVKAAARKSDEPTFVRGFWTQLAYLLHRNWRTYYRSPEFSLNRIGVIMLFTAVFAGFFRLLPIITAAIGDVGVLRVERVDATAVGRIVLVVFVSSLTTALSSPFVHD